MEWLELQWHVLGRDLDDELHLDDKRHSVCERRCGHLRIRWHDHDPLDRLDHRRQIDQCEFPEHCCKTSRVNRWSALQGRGTKYPLSCGRRYLHPPSKRWYRDVHRLSIGLRTDWCKR